MWLLNVCLEPFCQIRQMNNIHELNLGGHLPFLFCLHRHKDFDSDTTSQPSNSTAFNHMLEVAILRLQ